MPRRSDPLRERRQASNRLALVVFGLAAGLLVLFGLGFTLVYLYQQGAAKVGGGNAHGGPGGLPGLPGVPGLGALGGEVLWPQIQGRWKHPGFEREPNAPYIEFSADRRMRIVLPGMQITRDGRTSNALQDEAITRIESVGADGTFRVWYVVRGVGLEGYSEFKLVGDTLLRDESGPDIRGKKVVTYVKVR